MPSVHDFWKTLPKGPKPSLAPPFSSKDLENWHLIVKEGRQVWEYQNGQIQTPVDKYWLGTLEVLSSP
jgi:hypothetical protein